MTLETELRDRLASAAAGADRWDDDWAAADAVIDRRRAEKRRRAVGGALAAVCAVAIGVLVPTVGSGLFADSSAPPADGVSPSPATTAPATSAPPTTPVPGLSPLDGWNSPTRGSLAGDADFVRTLGKQAFLAMGQVTDRHVAFAGDVGGRRWGLVVGNLGGVGSTRWFVGQPGTPADALVEANGNNGQPGAGAAIGEQVENNSSTVFVLGRPGDRAFRAPVEEVPGRGSVAGESTEVPLDDGVATFELPASAGLTEVRVERDGAAVATQLVGFATAGHSPGDQDGVAALAGAQPLRGVGGPASGLAVDAALRTVLDPTGLSVDQVRPVVLWKGSVAMSGDTPVQGVVLALTMPSGQVVTTAAWGVPDGSSLPLSSPGQGSCGTSVHPAGTSVDGLVVVGECMIGNGIAQRSLLVTAPPAVSQVQLETGAGLGAPQPLAGSGPVADPGAVAGVTVSGPGFGRVSVPVITSNAPFSLDGK